MGSRGPDLADLHAAAPPLFSCFFALIFVTEPEHKGEGPET